MDPTSMAGASNASGIYAYLASNSCILEDPTSLEAGSVCGNHDAQA
jgi:hypothetical protein